MNNRFLNSISSFAELFQEPLLVTVPENLFIPFTLVKFRGSGGRDCCGA